MIYLDYNATAPVRPEVILRMQEMRAVPANPSSVHRFGREAKKHLENARKIIADAISAWPTEIMFTGSGTEANATALRGTGRRVLVSAVEHSSILKPSSLVEESRVEGNSPHTQASNMLQQSLLPNPPSPGGRGNIIPVDANGIVDLAALEKMLAGAPALVSVMLANNETGVIQPIREISELCKKHGALLHTDAVQGLGKIPVDFATLGCDMMTISAHKCGGAVGAAALVVRRDLPITPLLVGGGQELGRRAGTENIAAIAGFARAVELFDFAHMKKLRGWLDKMEKEMAAMVFGQLAPRLPNTSYVAMPGVGNEVQLMDFDLKGFAVSAGSACSSGRIEISHVLTAMGAPRELAGSAIRVSGGWATTEVEICRFTDAWKSTCERLATTGKVA